MMQQLLAAVLDRRGGVAMIAAIFVPVILAIGCGAVDLAAVRGDHSAMQDAADATALDAAKQLGIADQAGIAARASQFMATQIPQVVKNDGVTADTTFDARQFQSDRDADGSPRLLLRQPPAAGRLAAPRQRHRRLAGHDAALRAELRFGRLGR